MTPNRIAKMLQRQLMVSWREQPTRYDIEALQANVRRVGLVIAVRWALVAALTVYSVLAAWAYMYEIPWSELWVNMRIPAFALVFVLVYNTFYQLTYKRLGNIAILNHAQLIFDAVVVTVLVYYSGGVHSWFWAMYPLFILEAAFILPRQADTWFIAAFCAVAAGFVIWGEYFGLLPHTDMPFMETALHQNRTFVSVRYMWQITLLAGTATVATRMMASTRAREVELAASSIVDDKTGLYDRHYFLRALNSEVVRAEHDGRPVYVLLMDINEFSKFNELVGFERGDKMLREVADAISRALEEVSVPDTNVAARFGGEEFAVIFTEHSTKGRPSIDDAVLLAESIRRAVAEIRVADAGVTVSIGVAGFPADAATSEQLLDAADEALLAATVAGGNVVKTASDSRG